MILLQVQVTILPLWTKLTTYTIRGLVIFLPGDTKFHISNNFFLNLLCDIDRKTMCQTKPGIF